MTNHAKDAFNKIWDLAKHCEVLDDGDLYPALYFKDDKNTPDDELIEDMYEERVFIPIIQAAIDADRAERDEHYGRKMDDLARKYEARIAELEDERDRLRKFVEYAMGGLWDGCEPDGCSLQDKAEELKLIEERPASQSFRDEWDCDTWYQCVWTPAKGVSDE